MGTIIRGDVVEQTEVLVPETPPPPADKKPPKKDEEEGQPSED